ncbi:Plasmodium variant antigen protein Cir/Yir/Bir, putative [Plasmodium chabaudi chabaudi]|uniref:Plasmodium variant antigen protein Cir/Yir/Bir, putative n=1 Tax=Plasmodium chabaudi chabaudi TaxID=31271 RepID=A0A1D3LA42_PLACU|nr:Plasmodium variant antigen protein Cir/Yir/Bir, putative [Plasmodium chabaudi chabaudi]
MSKKLCEHIHKIDNLIKVKKTDKGASIEADKIFEAYCPNYKKLEKGVCSYYSDIVISAFITLLTSFVNDTDGGNIEKEKLTQYAILWVSYKINQHPNINGGINYIYDAFISDSDWVSDYNNYIDQIKKFMDIKDMAGFYDAFEILCKMHTEFNEEAKKCEKCSNYAEDFIKKFEKLNENYSNTDGSSYRQILCTLSTDYNNLKNDYDKNCSGCSDIPQLSEIKTPPSSLQDSIHSSSQGSELSSLQGPELSSLQDFEVTPLTTSIASKLIPGLLAFAIPIFLGVAYKYSLFGFDKRLQRQYLREKLKKIKKKMISYL